MDYFRQNPMHSKGVPFETGKRRTDSATGARTLLANIEVFRIQAERSSQNYRQSELLLEYRHQVDVIRNDTIAQDAHSSLTEIVQQRFQVSWIIGPAEEDGRSISPALRQGVWDSRDHDTC